MKVLVVHNQGPPGLPSGETTVAREEAEGLRAKGHDVRLELVSSGSIDAMGKAALTRAALNVAWSWPAARRLGRVLDGFKPDVVHFHAVLPGLSPSAFYACKRRGIPVVQTLHNFRWLCVEGGLFRRGAYCDDCITHNALSGAYHRCARGSAPLSALLTLMNAVYLRTGLLFRLVDDFVAVSEFVRGTYVKKGFPEDRVHLKYNGLRVPDLPSKAPARSGIAYVGRLTEAKGMAHLKHMMGAMPATPFAIVGDGPYMQDLREHAAATGANVDFKGQVDAAGAYDTLAAAECAVVPSVCGESFGRVALEAMAVGTPVVGSRVGGLAELLEGNGGAVPVDPADPEAFVTAVNGIIGNKRKVAAMGRAGREFLDRGDYAGDFVSGLITIYEAAIDRKRSGAR
jgi:glycosyltransferase involved in cell wall biosynthesis